MSPYSLESEKSRERVFCWLYAAEEEKNLNELTMRSIRRMDKYEVW